MLEHLLSKRHGRVNKSMPFPVEGLEQSDGGLIPAPFEVVQSKGDDLDLWTLNGSGSGGDQHTHAHKDHISALHPCHRQ